MERKQIPISSSKIKILVRPRPKAGNRRRRRRKLRSTEEMLKTAGTTIDFQKVTRFSTRKLMVEKRALQHFQVQIILESRVSDLSGIKSLYYQGVRFKILENGQNLKIRGSGYLSRDTPEGWQLRFPDKIVYTVYIINTVNTNI